MNHLTLSLLALVAGVLLAMQGGLNAQLGVLLQNPILASLIAFSCSTVFALLLFISTGYPIPDVTEMATVPKYLWFLGGLFSVIGISLYYFTIPQLGVSKMISLGLTGQLLFALIAGHFGWFNLPEEPISFKRLLGALAMITGIFLLNIK